MNPDAADKPFNYPARLRAAEKTTDVAARIRLLRNAIAVDPVPIAPRVELFRAYFDANQFDNAVAVFRGSNVPEDMSLRSTLWRDTGIAHRKLGNLEEARRYFTMLTDDPAKGRNLAEIEAELERIQENQRRMPHVHENLDQTTRVRPRVRGDDRDSRGGLDCDRYGLARGTKSGYAEQFRFGVSWWSAGVCRSSRSVGLVEGLEHVTGETVVARE